jgi:hypothetical protein
MIISVAILVMSQVVDWLEPAFGLSITAVLVAADIAALLLSGSAVLIERAALPALGRLWRRVSGDRSRLVNTLCGVSLVVLVPVALVHLHRSLRLDAWLAVLGAVLLPIGGLLVAREHRGQK